jgi:Lectin C-type domain
MFFLVCLDNPTLTGGGTSDTCSNNVSDTRVQMTPALTDPERFGKISFIDNKKSYLQVSAFENQDNSDPTFFLCEKINEYSCNPGSFLFEGLCYTYINSSLTHAQADQMCHLMGGQILKIESRKQQTFINAALMSSGNTYYQIWLDYRKFTYPYDNSFRAIDDTTFIFNSSGIDFTNINLPIDPSLNCVAITYTPDGYFDGWQTISCLANASSICQQEQLLSQAFTRIIPAKQVLLPLDLNSGFKDLVYPQRGNIANLVAITTEQFVPSGLVGASHFLGTGDSFIQIDNVGSSKGIRYMFGISVSMWIYIDLIYDGETQFLIDARPDCVTGSEIDEAFTMSLINSQPNTITPPITNPSCSSLKNISGQPLITTSLSQNVVLASKLCSYNVTTKCDIFISPQTLPIPVKKWTHIGFSYNAVSKQGTFFINSQFGYYNKISGQDVLGKYFKYDSANWFTNASSVAVNAPVQVGSGKYQQSNAFSGKLSCLQWYEGPLKHSQFQYLKDCPVNATYPRKAALCPQGFEYYKKNCFKFSSKPQDFATAEAYCTSSSGTIYIKHI